MTNETRTAERVEVRSIKAGLVTWQDGFRIQFLEMVPAWVANAEAQKIRKALNSGEMFVADFDAFRVPAPVEDFRF